MSGTVQAKGTEARSLGEGMGSHERLAQMQSPEAQREVSGRGKGLARGWGTY